MMIMLFVFVSLNVNNSMRHNVSIIYCDKGGFDLASEGLNIQSEIF